MNPDIDDQPDPYCMGCSKIIEEGSVVAFGDGIWHVECFKCAKCNTHVECDSNLLLLSDGSPVCENCSYNCHTCKLPIRDEAIMTGDEAYHADCFRCVQCKKKIDDLVFTQTTKGIFCTACHEQRKADKQRRKEEKAQQLLLQQQQLQSQIQQKQHQSSVVVNYNEKSLPLLPPQINNESTTSLRSTRSTSPSSNRHASRMFDPQQVSEYMAAAGASNVTAGPAAKHLRTPLNTFHQRNDSLGASPKPSISEPPRGRSDSIDQFGASRKATSPTPNSSNRGQSADQHRKTSLESQSANNTLYGATRTDVLDLLAQKPNSAPAAGARQPNVKLGAKILDPAIFLNPNGLPPSSPPEQPRGLPPAPRPKMSPSTTLTTLNTIASANSSTTSLLNSYTEQHGSPTNSSSDISSDSSTSRLEHTIASPKSLDFGLPLIPPLTFSFSFEKDSEELSNLTKLLGSSLVEGDDDSDDDLDDEDLYQGADSSYSKNSNRTTFGGGEDGSLAEEIPPVPPTPRSFVSSVPSVSVDGSSEFDPSGFPQPPTALPRKKSNASIMDDDQQFDAVYVRGLKAELQSSRDRLVEVESNFNKIKTVSRRALEEFNRAKDEFAKEVALRQQAEIHIHQLRAQVIAYQQAGFTSDVTKEDHMRMSFIRGELEKAVNDLRFEREAMMKEIEELVKQKQAGLASSADPTSHYERLKQALLIEIRSLKAERDTLFSETNQLNNLREETINETVMLNTKNAELTNMNNDLSRRVTEREREAAAVIAATSFLNSTPTANGKSTDTPPLPRRKSSDTHTHAGGAVTKVVQRDSFNGTQAPKMFKFKKGKGFNLRGNNPKAVGGTNDNKAVPHQNNNGQAGPSVQPYGATAKRDQRTARSGHSQDTTVQSLAQGSHVFQPTSILRPVKCDVCGEKLWGLSELRCQACGFLTHSKCVHQVPQYCLGLNSTAGDYNPNDSDGFAKGGVSMFGNDLAKQLEMENRPVPLVVQKCIHTVEVRGMDYEGIYRKSGGASQMRTIQLLFEQGDEPDLEDMDEYNDICAVTSVLKQYFRELPNPLLTYELYPNFLEACALPNGEEKLNSFYELLEQLPAAHYYTLKALMVHLNKVQKMCGENLMTSKNLAVVFGPTLMRDRDASRDLLDMNYKNAAIEYIIGNVDALFPINDEMNQQERREGFI